MTKTTSCRLTQKLAVDNFIMKSCCLHIGNFNTLGTWNARRTFLFSSLSLFVCVCERELSMCFYFTFSLLPRCLSLSPVDSKMGIFEEKGYNLRMNARSFESVAGWFAAFRHVFFSESTDFITRSKTFASFFVATHSDCSLILKCATYAFVLFCRLEI